MNHAVVLAGGSGTRLWPLSNRETPKQLAPLFEGRSLLEIAMDRLESLVPSSRRYICTSRSWADRIKTLIPGMALSNIIGEPVGRDTLAALALSTFWISRHDPEATIAFLTSDHIITPAQKLTDCLAEAFRLIDQDPRRCVTLGVVPDHPATGYGYLELGESVGDDTEARRVLTFKEKPELALAEGYLAMGPQRYVWNSGMFVWKASTFLNALHRLAPDIHQALSPISILKHDSELAGFLEKVYPTVRKISVDFGLMEPVSRSQDVNIVALPLDAQWRDVGSWRSMAELLSKDESENAVAPGADGLLIDCEKTVVISDKPGHMIVAVGLKDYVIVHTDNATLILPAKDAEKIKQVHGQVLGYQSGKFA